VLACILASWPTRTPLAAAELGTYSQLHDVRKAALKHGDATGRLVASIDDQVRVCGHACVPLRRAHCVSGRGLIGLTS
jgi:hypothetical protein